MAVGGMDPLDVIRCCQDGTGDGSFALAHLDAVASKNDKALYISQETTRAGNIYCQDLPLLQK